MLSVETILAGLHGTVNLLSGRNIFRMSLPVRNFLLQFVSSNSVSAFSDTNFYHLCVTMVLVNVPSELTFFY